MIKYIPIVGIFAIFTFIGYIYGESFRKRFVDLKSCYKYILLLQNEVLYNMTPLPEALSSLSNKVNGVYKELISKVSKDLSSGRKGDVYSSFKDNYVEYESEIYLSKEDKRILGDFFRSLGDSGVYGQDKVFNLVLENLKINIDEAMELTNKNTKLYRYLGMCFGAMISIFLL